MECSQCFVITFHSDIPGFYYGDHFEMYRNIESLCCIIGVNSFVGQLYLINKLTENEVRLLELVMGGRGIG